MLVTLAEAKEYLHVDYNDEDATITTFIMAGSKLVTDTLRLDAEPTTPTDTVKIATMFAVAYLFEHREDADMKALSEGLRYILSMERKAAF